MVVGGEISDPMAHDAFPLATPMFLSFWTEIDRHYLALVLHFDIPRLL